MGDGPYRTPPVLVQLDPFPSEPPDVTCSVEWEASNVAVRWREGKPGIEVGVRGGDPKYACLKHFAPLTPDEARTLIAALRRALAETDGA